MRIKGVERIKRSLDISLKLLTPAPPTLELRDRSPFAIRSTLPPIPGDYFGLGHRNPRKTGIRDSATPRQASQSVRAPNGAMEHWSIGAADLPFDWWSWLGGDPIRFETQELGTETPAQLTRSNREKKSAFKVVVRSDSIIQHGGFYLWQIYLIIPYY